MLNEKNSLFKWENPLKAFLDVPNLDLTPIRSAILRILRDGLVDGGQRRHALNALEIHEILNRKILEGQIEYKKGNQTKPLKQISITNLYFHLNYLVDSKLISIVGEILEGPLKRNKTKYYGRVARYLFLTDEEESLNRYKRQFLAFKELAEIIDIKLPIDIDGYPQKYHKMKLKRYDIISDWIVSQDQDIRKNEINHSDLFEFLKMMDLINPEHDLEIGQLAGLLQNELIKDKDN